MTAPIEKSGHFPLGDDRGKDTLPIESGIHLLMIRQEQFAELQGEADRRFAGRNLESIRSRVAPRVDHVADADLQRLIVAIMGRARSYGIAEDRDIIAYICLTLGVARFFDRYPRFRRILTDGSMPGWFKMTRIFDEATDEDWNRAAKLTAKD